MKTDEKSNEITDIPALLKMLDIRGCLITIDAMRCQKEIADTIITKGADYLLALKTNQELLHRAVVSAFREAALTTETRIEKGHGRIDAREYYVHDAEDIARAFPQWKNLRTIGMAINYQNDGEKEGVHYRYYISSAELTTEQFGKAVRGHWGIESRLHWVLDTAMKEDACQIYKDNGAENLARLRHIARNVIQADNSRKASVRSSAWQPWIRTIWK